MQFPGARRAAGTLVQSLRKQVTKSTTCCSNICHNVTTIPVSLSKVKIPSLFYGKQKLKKKKKIIFLENSCDNLM